jgi:putative transposase
MTGRHLIQAISGAQLVGQAALREAVPKYQPLLPADCGAPVRSKLLAEALVDLGTEASFFRPQQRNHNPYSDGLFKTTKHARDFPAGFAGIDHAHDVVPPSFVRYKRRRRHTGIGLMTPAATEHRR